MPNPFDFIPSVPVPAGALAASLQEAITAAAAELQERLERVCWTATYLGFGVLVTIDDTTGLPIQAVPSNRVPFLELHRVPESGLDTYLTTHKPLV